MTPSTLYMICLHYTTRVPNLYDDGLAPIRTRTPAFTKSRVAGHTNFIMDNLPPTHLVISPVEKNCVLSSSPAPLRRPLHPAVAILSRPILIPDPHSSVRVGGPLSSPDLPLWNPRYRAEMRGGDCLVPVFLPDP